jgi:hypothetical protein
MGRRSRDTGSLGVGEGLPLFFPGRYIVKIFPVVRFEKYRGFVV